MKYSFIALCGFLALAPAAMAEGEVNIETMQEAQSGNIIVTGKIVDDMGEPLPGAAVYVKGTTNGVITDIDGNFSLNAPADGTVVCSFVGYNNIEMEIGGRKNLGTISMESDSKELETVVVIGYGTQKKVDLTGSVAVVDAEQLKKVSNSNISTMLEGKVAGVQVTSDGQPGADPAVRIRGLGSFGSTAPLYVIDGVPMGTTIRDFSPNDIATMQVLKDASAAAIYGSRAANGVVIITTKQGKKNEKMKIDYSGYIGMDKIDKGVYDVMNTEEYAQYVTMACENSGVEVPSGYDPNSSNYLVGKVDTDWFDESFKTGVRQNHNINMSGGGEHNTYNVALDYFSQKGTMEGAGPNFDRFTARVNNTMDVKFIKFKTSVVYSHSNQDSMALSNASEYVQGLYGSQYPVMASVLLLPPSIKAYDSSTWCLDSKYGGASDWSYDGMGYGTYYSDIHGEVRMSNVLLTNGTLERNTKVDRFLLTGSADVDILDMIGLKNENHKLDYNINLSWNKTFCKDFTFVPAFFLSDNVKLTKSNEQLIEGYRNSTDGLVENTLTYDGKIGLSHVNLVVGQTFERERYHSLTGYGNNLPEPYFLQISNAATTSADSYESEHVLCSFIGRLNYDFDGKYLVSATVRRDGSSRLSSDDRWDFFPSVSAGWRLDKENFFTLDDSMINLLKIRGSYGVLGNENIGEYQYMDTMSRGDYTYSFGGTKVTGSSISNYVNTAIRWEKKKTTDVGFDLGMFNNMLEFNFDWYKAKSEDLLYSVAVPAQAGATNETVTMNAATMENTGLEFAASYHNYDHPVKYEISANVSTQKNKVTSLGITNEGRTDGYCRTEVGAEVGRFYGYVYEGIYRTQEDLDNHALNSGAKLGDCMYKDTNNDGVINSDDRVFLGSGMPKLNFGLSARVEFKGFDLSVSTYGAAKYKLLDDVDKSLHSSYGYTNKNPEVLNAWTPENPNSNTPRVALTSEATINNDALSSRFLKNGTYYKIANIELGYNFSDNLFKGYFNNVRLYVSAQNVATFSEYVGYNVDFAGGTFTPGYNYCSYPAPRTFMAGLHFSF